MELLSVSAGTVFWATVSFIIVLVILKKFAWRPILDGLRSREESIENALNEAKKAREEMASLRSSNEQMQKEARAERDQILKEARETKDQIVAEAKETASEVAEKLVENAKLEIENQKKAALVEIKNQVGTLSIEIAEKLVRETLSNDEKQQSLVNSLLKDVKLN
jgi:F-type H+-transporting ATPase subunit b